MSKRSYCPIHLGQSCYCWIEQKREAERQSNEAVQPKSEEKGEGEKSSGSEGADRI